MARKGSDESIEWYLKLLFNVMLCNIVPKKYITELSASNYVYYWYNKAVDQNHLIEQYITIIENDRAKKVKCCCITPDGIQHLKENYALLPEHQQWVKDIPHATGRLLYKPRNANSKKLERFLKVSSVTFVMNMLDVSDSAVQLVKADRDSGTCKDNSPKRTTSKKQTQEESVYLSSLIAQAKPSPLRKPNSNIQQTSNNVCEYISSIQIKNTLQSVLHDSKRVYLYKFVGIVYQRNNATLIYVSKNGQIAWNPTTTITEIQFMRLYGAKIRHQPLSLIQPNGILILSDMTAFHDEMRREKLWKEIRAYNAMIVVPESFVGFQNIMDWIQTDYSTIKADFEQAMIQSGHMQTNQNELTKHIFELTCNEESMPHWNLRDLAQIRKIIHAIETRTITAVGIICYEWQEEMYRQALPTIDIDFMFVNRASPSQRCTRITTHSDST